jgi:membrane peptidoglycan carboxypeptidase
VKRFRPVLGALVLVAAVVGYVVWQRPAEPVIPPPPPKEVVLQYADGSKLWSSTDGGPPPPPLVARVFKELTAASMPLDRLKVSGAVVRTTIDVKAQTVAAAVVGRLVPAGRQVGASVTAVDPATGGVRVYVAGRSRQVDLAGGTVVAPTPVIVEPFTLAGATSVLRAQMSPLDMSSAYAILAAGGVQRTTHFVTRVASPDGTLLYQAADTAKPLFGTDVADRITARLKEKPACNGIACVPSYPWMAGYTPQLAGTVFMEPFDEMVLDGAVPVVDADLPRVVWHEFLAEMTG